jgi:hypothetical protein
MFESEVNYKDWSPYLRAWEKYYMLKGCTPTKASHLAYKKVEKGKMYPKEKK